MLQLDQPQSELEEKAKIYGKSGRSLTPYQVAVNNAAIVLAKENRDVVFDKGRCNICIYHRHAFLSMKLKTCREYITVCLVVALLV